VRIHGRGPSGFDSPCERHSTLSVRHQEAKQAARAQFDRWASSYDRSWLRELIFYPAMRVCREEILRWQQRRGGGPYDLLDVGCATGRFLLSLLDSSDARQLVGLDYSAEMIRRFGEKIAALGDRRLRAVHGDAERLPFDAACFDVVTCCNSFHHYPHQAAVLREFHRVLRRGGVLVLVDGFRDNVIGWVLFDVAVGAAEKNVHHAAWSQVRQMCEAAGFAEIRQRKLNVLVPLLVTVAAK